jgi:DNA-binding CsgD family transcriptional regulator
MATPVPFSLPEPPADAVAPDWAAGDADPRQSWDALLRGGWFVVAHARDDHTHTIVTARPDGDERARVLTARELRLAVGRARGASIKALSIDLGVTYMAAQSRIAQAMRKLHLRSTAELVALFGLGTTTAAVDSPLGGPSSVPLPDGLAFRRVRRGRDYLVITYAPPRWPLPEHLSAAEQRAVRQLVAGATQRAIAGACGVSPRTVANQLASAYRKMRVRSSVELFIALRGASPRA